MRILAISAPISQPRWLSKWLLSYLFSIAATYQSGGSLALAHSKTDSEPIVNQNTSPRTEATNAKNDNARININTELNHINVLLNNNSLSLSAATGVIAPVNKDATRALIERVRKNHNDGNAWLGLGDDLAANEHAVEAERAYKHALLTAPQNSNIWNNLGTVLKQQGKLQEAQAAYLKSLQLDPKHGSWTNLANVRKLLGDTKGEQEARIQAEKTGETGMWHKLKIQDVFPNLDLHAPVPSQ